MKNSLSLHTIGRLSLALLLSWMTYAEAQAQTPTIIAGSLTVGTNNNNNGTYSVTFGSNSVISNNSLSSFAMGSSTVTGTNSSAFNVSQNNANNSAAFNFSYVPANAGGTFAANGGQVGYQVMMFGGSSNTVTNNIPRAAVFNHGYVNAVYSFAANYGEADDPYSAAFGYGTLAYAPSQFVIGQFNEPLGPGLTNNPACNAVGSTNALFIIGNGSPSNFSNAMVVRMDGLVLINPGGDISMGSFTSGTPPTP